MSGEPASAAFLVFAWSELHVGVAAALVAAVYPDRDEANIRELDALPADSAQPPRLLVLRSRGDKERPPLRIRGALKIVTLPVDRVVPLPALFLNDATAAIAVALDEERISFIVVDPYRLNDMNAREGAAASPREIR